MSIDPSSEQAMVVAPDGGYCVCPSTGATCGGRFAGCTEIVSHPGRIPPKAPRWSLRSVRAAVPAANVPVVLSQTALAATTVDASEMMPLVADPTRVTKSIPVDVSNMLPLATVPRANVPRANVPIANVEPDVQIDLRAQTRSLCQINASIESLRLDLAEIHEGPQSASVEDVAEAVVITQQDIAEGTRQVLQLKEMFSDLTGIVSSIQKRQEAAERDRNDDVANAVADLGLAMAELTRLQKDTVEVLAPIPADFDETAQRQSGEIHALGCQITEINSRMANQRSAEMVGDELTGTLEDIRLELMRLSPESDEMMAATQLANTVNTLRDAGVEDLSAAHLIHSIQVDMRTMRDEIRTLSEAVMAMTSQSRHQ